MKISTKKQMKSLNQFNNLIFTYKNYSKKITKNHTMKEDLLSNQEFMQACKNAAYNALNGIVDEEELKKFLEAPSNAAVPKPIWAEATLGVIGIFGGIGCKPEKSENQPWKFDATVWGLGGAVFKGIGFIYTAYTSWEAFFERTAGFHAQGVADMGGIFQINWFNKGGVPVGQFNSISGGLGAFQVGGQGKWVKTK